MKLTPAPQRLQVVSNGGYINQAWLEWFAQIVRALTSAPGLQKFNGDPNGSVLGVPGDLVVNTAGGAGTTLYVKESGNGTATGWVAK